MDVIGVLSNEVFVCIILCASPKSQVSVGERVGKYVDCKWV